MDGFELAAVAEADLPALVGWSYELPYDIYDLGSDLGFMLDPALRYSAVRRDGDLIAYSCIGADARVPGLDAAPGTDDLGFGLHPGLVGQGHSRTVLPWLLGALGDQIVGDHLRVVILEWNIRSLKAYRRVGFRDVGTHSNAADTYLLLTRPRP
jgi:ribosomal-protein-alanine N-acetyltransferase